MEKMTVLQASETLGITKEAIYNRIRRGSLESVSEKGVRYIILPKSSIDENNSLKTSFSKSIKKNSNSNESYIKHLIEQIKELRDMNTKLEKDKEQLIVQKEQMLIESRLTLERIYKERDEQLKNILSIANKQNSTHLEKNNFSEHMIEAVIEPSQKKDEENIDFDNWQDLKKYFKNKSQRKN